MPNTRRHFEPGVPGRRGKFRKSAVLGLAVPGDSRELTGRNGDAVFYRVFSLLLHAVSGGNYAMSLCAHRMREAKFCRRAPEPFKRRAVLRAFPSN